MNVIIYIQRIDLPKRIGWSNKHTIDRNENVFSLCDYNGVPTANSFIFEAMFFRLVRTSKAFDGIVNGLRQSTRLDGITVVRVGGRHVSARVQIFIELSRETYRTITAINLRCNTQWLKVLQGPEQIVFRTFQVYIDSSKFRICTPGAHLKKV